MDNYHATAYQRRIARLAKAIDAVIERMGANTIVTRADISERGVRIHVYEATVRAFCDEPTTKAHPANRYGYTHEITCELHGCQLFALVKR